MKGLSPSARRVLDGARPGDEPGAADRLRVREAIARRLALAAAASSVVTAASKASTAASASAGAVAGTGIAGAGPGSASALGSIVVAAKVATAIAALGIVGAGAVVARREMRADDEQGESAPALVRRVDPTPACAGPPSPILFPLAPVGPAPMPVGPARASYVPKPSAAATPAGASGRAAAPASPPARPPDRPPGSDVTNEVRLLIRAEVALQAGDVPAALAALDEHSRRYPAAVLSEERDAMRIAALCEQGKASEAQVAAARFVRAFPGSPQMVRDGTPCRGAGTPTVAAPP